MHTCGTTFTYVCMYVKVASLLVIQIHMYVCTFILIHMYLCMNLN